MPLPSEEQTMLRDMAHNWVARNAPVSALRALRDSEDGGGFDPELFQSMAAMGWTGALIDEEHGGADIGFVGMGAIVEELGRTLVAAPLCGSAVGCACAISLGGTASQQSRWLPAIAGGELIGALAVDETSRHAPESISLSATAASGGDGGFVLAGAKTLVHEGSSAGLFVVSARTSGKVDDGEGISLFLVAGDTVGVTRQKRELMDSRDYADVIFDKVQVGSDALLGEVGAGADLLEKILDRTRLAVAAESVGLAQQAFDITLDYLKTRVQFGQLIGGFQALQHRAAKMFSDIQMAKATIEAALFALDQDASDAPAMVSLAKATANELAHSVSREMIQMHGGIGMTDAHDAGFYIKRARVLEAAYGTTSFHRDRYGRLAGI